MVTTTSRTTATPADGKKYGRTHLAYLTAICALKRVLSSWETKALSRRRRWVGGQALYPNFWPMDMALSATAAPWTGHPPGELAGLA
jgi:hypothetical protein